MSPIPEHDITDVELKNVPLPVLESSSSKASGESVQATIEDHGFSGDESSTIGGRSVTTQGHVMSSSLARPDDTVQLTPPLLEKPDLREFMDKDSRYHDGRNQKSIFPPGWPKIAWLHDSRTNLKIYRAFEYGLWRVLLRKACALAIMEEGIQAFDRTHPEHIRSPPGYSPDSEALLDKFEVEFRDYAWLLDHMRNMQQDGEVDIKVHTEMLTKIHKDDMLEAGAYPLYGVPEDWRSFSRRQPDWFNGLLFSSASRKLLRWFGHSKNSEGCSTKVVSFILSSIYIFAVGVLLLVPATTLLLAQLTRPQTCAVLITALTVFCGIVSMVHKLDLAGMLRAAIGYLAVMAAFAVAGYST